MFPCLSGTVVLLSDLSNQLITFLGINAVGIE